MKVKIRKSHQNNPIFLVKVCISAIVADNVLTRRHSYMAVNLPARLRGTGFTLGLHFLDSRAIV